RLELVVPADRCETDTVVDLGDLVQRRGVVLRHHRDPTGIAQDDDGAPPCDALAGELRPVHHLLLGTDIERQAHSAYPLGPSGRAVRAATMVWASFRTPSSDHRATPAAEA